MRLENFDWDLQYILEAYINNEYIYLENNTALLILHVYLGEPIYVGIFPIYWLMDALIFTDFQPEKIPTGCLPPARTPHVRKWTCLNRSKVLATRCH